MRTLYLDRKGLALEVDDQCLVLREGGGERQSLPLRMIERVVILNEVDLSSGLLTALGARQIPLTVVSRRDPERFAVLGGGPRPDAARRVAQYRGYSDGVWRLEAARRIVHAKLSAQCRLLTQMEEAAPGERMALRMAAEQARVARTRLEVGIGSLGELTGIEGAAAASYFGAFTRTFPESLGFTKRTRRPPRDPVNAVLSLSYTLGYSLAGSEIRMAGLDPFLGFLHEPTHGRESLACDLLEPVRARLDGWVHGLFRTRTVRMEHFRTAQGGCLLGKAGRRAYYEAFTAEEGALRRQFKRFVYALIRSLGGGGEAESEVLDEGAVS